jgi:hypothetical protein
VSRSNPHLTFRPPPDLKAQLEEYCRQERRGSVNEALTVLVADALERWRLSQRSRVERLSECP